MTENYSEHKHQSYLLFYRHSWLTAVWICIIQAGISTAWNHAEATVFEPMGIGSKLQTLLHVLILAGFLFIVFRLFRTPCILELYEDGFCVKPRGRFNFLLTNSDHIKWRDFSYQSGGPIDYQENWYNLSIHLNSGKSYSFLVRNKPLEVEKMERLHQEIEKLVLGNGTQVLPEKVTQP